MSATGRTPPSTSLALNASIGTRRESPCGIPSSTAEKGCFSMTYLIEGLSPDRFAPFFALDDAGLAAVNARRVTATADRSEEHTSELQSLMRISYAVFCLKKNKTNINHPQPTYTHVDNT